MSRGMPLGKQLATVGSRSARPLENICPGSVCLTSFHLASAQGWKEGSSFPLKVGAGSLISAQTPLRSGAWVEAAAFFAGDCAAVWAEIAVETTNIVSTAQIGFIHRIRIWRLPSPLPIGVVFDAAGYAFALPPAAINS